jgi:hypothetical protein
MVVQDFDDWVIVEEKAIALALQNGRSAIKERERLFVPTGDDDRRCECIPASGLAIR